MSNADGPRNAFLPVTQHYTINSQQTTDGDGNTTTMLHVGGELDLAARQDLLDAVMRPIAEGTDLLIDLEAVTFLDSESLSALIQGFNAAGEAGTGFRLVGARGTVRRVLEVTGVLGLAGSE